MENGSLFGFKSNKIYYAVQYIAGFEIIYLKKNTIKRE